MMADTTKWILACALTVGLAAGCNRDYDEGRSGDGAPGTAESEGAEARAENIGQDVQDAWITTKIEAQYFADPDVKGRNIEVSTQDGVVTLAGVIDDPDVRRQAIEIAQNTDGVTRVDAQLVERAAAAAPAAGDGSRAATDRDATAPAPAGSGAPAEGAAEPSRQPGEVVDKADSSWITTKIQAQLFANDRLKSRRIDVSTHNGVVTLAGQVESDEERQQVLQIARQTEGVRRVDDQLRLATTAGDPRSGEPGAATADAQPEPAKPEMAAVPPLDAAGARTSDEGITTRVQSKFFADDRLSAEQIDVQTNAGVVTLSGNVSDEAHRQAALSIARSVDGVQRIEDRLTIQQQRAASAPPAGDMARAEADDEWLTTKIQSNYFLDEEVKKGRITVQTDNGVVTLTGEVPSAEAKSRAEQIARNTSGVTEVRNELTIGGIGE